MTLVTLTCNWMVGVSELIIRGLTGNLNKACQADFQYLFLGWFTSLFDGPELIRNGLVPM